MSGDKRILAIAYACSPYRGSEHGVGWGWVRMIARKHAVDVVTAESNRSDIERYQNTHEDMSNVVFHYIEHNYSRSMDRLFPPYYLATYNKWLDMAYRLALQLEAKHSYALCHLITYVGFRHPGKFYKLDIPFVWGPIGGLENTSWRLLPAMGLRGALYYALRNMVNSMDKMFLSGPKAAFKRAAQLGSAISATSSIQNEINKWYGVDSPVICEIGSPEREGIVTRRRADDEPFRICWSGAHLPGKALPLLLKALKRLPVDIDWRLDVLGGGPCSAGWRGLAKDIGIDGLCRWHGNLDRDEALRIMSEAHLFVVTSLKDLTSSVLLEALSLGLPVVCPDHCGFSDVVNDSCGIKIPVQNISQIITGFKEALSRLMKNEELRQSMAHRAIERADEFSWENKSQKLEYIYKSVYGKPV